MKVGVYFLNQTQLKKFQLTIASQDQLTLLKQLKQRYLLHICSAEFVECQHRTHSKRNLRNMEIKLTKALKLFKKYQFVITNQHLVHHFFRHKL